jgi:arylsulfatase A-like enzyme
MRCIRSVDDSVGRIQAYLEENGLLENTVFIYSSDQGFYLGEHGWFDKRFMYDESYRTPLLVSWPGVIEPGSVNGNLVSNLDFAQTFLDLAELQAPVTMQGKSLVPLLQGESPTWRKYHYYHYYEYPGWHMVYRHEGIYDGRFKLIHYYDVDEWELIDTKKDPLELKSVYGERAYASVQKELKAALQAKKTEYSVPSGVPQPRQVQDPMRYYSSQRREAEKTQ